MSEVREAVRRADPLARPHPMAEALREESQRMAHERLVRLMRGQR